MDDGSFGTDASVEPAAGSAPSPRTSFFLLSRREWGIVVLMLGITAAAIAMTATVIAQFESAKEQLHEMAGVDNRHAASISFDTSTCLIPTDEILAGGPPKDGIPAITSPALVSAVGASYLKNDDRVVGVVRGDEARAYPLRILSWHEAVNDVLGREPIAVTYCPLCDSVVVFDRRIDGTTLEFGISGLLYNSNVLLYDRRPDGEGESLWSQLQMRAVSGPAAKKGLTLTARPCDLTTWEDWKTRYPRTTVLSLRTGHRRNYAGTPYTSYFSHDDLAFPVNPPPDPAVGLRNKDKLVVVRAGGETRVYPVSAVARRAGEKSWIEQDLAGGRIRLTYLKDADSLRVEPTGKPPDDLSLAYTFWFAWSAMHPETDVFKPQAAP